MELLEKTRSALGVLFPEIAPLLVAEGEGGQETPPREAGVLATDPAKHGSHLDVLCGPDQVVAVARIMDREGYFLESISGVDWLDKLPVNQRKPALAALAKENPGTRVIGFSSETGEGREQLWKRLFDLTKIREAQPAES